MVGVEREAEDREGVRRRAGDAAGEPVRPGEEVLEDVLRGERRDGEVEPLSRAAGRPKINPTAVVMTPASGIAKKTGIP